MSCACESGFRIQGGARAASDARSGLTAELAARVSEDCLRDVHLIVSEIVNNSVLHGRVDEDGWIAIDLSFAESSVRVAVRDSALRGDPRLREPDYEDGGGFGLFLVDALSAAWGIEHEPVLTIWFELGVDGTL
jgi:anti-sigma regulatory factor (Ser/Thr protein kinase)